MSEAETSGSVPNEAGEGQRKERRLTDGEWVQIVEAYELGLKGVTELASDADIANITSHCMHAALGFEETERVVYFRKILPPAPKS